MRSGAKATEIVALDTGDNGFWERKSAGGSFVADVSAIVHNVGRDDAAAIFQDNRVRKRGADEEKEKGRKWRCATHILILAAAFGASSAGLPRDALSCYSRGYGVAGVEIVAPDGARGICLDCGVLPRK
jgi:hypothetical protein